MPGGGAPPRRAAALLLLLLPAQRGAVGRHCPVRLVDTVPGPDGEEKRLRMVDDGRQYLRTLAPPLFFVPVLGVYRGGKSLLLNRMMRLRAPYQDGFKVGHGQRTFTQGIEMCAEEVPGLGTVVWMDTEGLFSSADTHGLHGPKLFSFGLLFASVVLLNNQQVLNEHFVEFLSEQQQVARILKQHLVSEGLPEDALLPPSLSLFWVLQRPVRYDRQGISTREDLDAFLSKGKDRAREGVRHYFRHIAHEVPVATHNASEWSRLDQVPDSDLSRDYVGAVRALRTKVLDELKHSRSLSPTAVVLQLELYMKMVTERRFSPELAKEAFEEEKAGEICAAYSRTASRLAGPLPSRNMTRSLSAARDEADRLWRGIADEFHLGDTWLRRVDACLRLAEDALQDRNAEKVHTRWQKEAGIIAQGESCFFFRRLQRLLEASAANYSVKLSATARERSRITAGDLQRVRLVECIRYRHILRPLLPWIMFPFLWLQLRDRASARELLSSTVWVLMGGIMCIGFYSVLPVPAFLDIDGKVLRAHPWLLSLVMSWPCIILPWGLLANMIFLSGTVICAAWCLRRFAEALRRPGDAARQECLEQKLEAILQTAEAGARARLADAAQLSAAHAARGDIDAAAQALAVGLCTLRELWASDGGERPQSMPVDADAVPRLQALLRVFAPPGCKEGSAAHRRLCAAWREAELPARAVRQEWGKLLLEAERLLALCAAAAEAAGDDTPTAPDDDRPQWLAAAEAATARQRKEEETTGWSFLMRR